MASADLLLHPVRLRILQAFLGDRALTTTELRGELSDVPPASLYRHVARLVDAGVLAVVAERRARGATERTYTLRVAAAQLSPDEVATMTTDEHRQAFMAFTAGLLGDFDRYLAHQDRDLARDGVGYRIAGMWLNDLEYLEFLRDFTALIQNYMTKPPGSDRRRRILGTIFLLGDETSGGDE
jgi:DNA-binding transcriptional ArsR family regulator